MKKLICLLFAISVATLLSAKELPKEPSVITGKLENGFTYEIKQNSKPKEIAEFRLVVKAGSLEEDDDQKGLAHFVEHMAFNGSKNFKKNELIQYLESIGVSFGSHLNASTSYERTLYQLSVPVRNNNLEKSFLIFKDWADGLVFDKEAFEAERGVILEEARSRDTVNYRLFRKTKDMKYANSKYLEREPIGDLDIVRNVPVQRAIDFYNDWYRPNLMHFVAVGDFNTTKIESLIKEYFSELTNRSTRQPASRSIPENNSTRIRIVTDPETTSNFLDITFIENLDKLKTEKDLRQSLVESMMTALFNMKASEQILKANTKAKRIYMRGMAIGESRGGYKFVTHYNGLDELAALNELYALIWSFDKHGFSDGDLALIKKRLSSANESRYKRIKSQKSLSIVSALTSAYLSGSTYVDYEVLYSLHKRFIDEIALADINNKFKKIVALQDKAIIFVNSTGNKVAKRKILSTIKEAKKNIENFSLEKELPTKLLSNTLVSKKMMKKQYHKKFDYHEYLLANGIRVAFKQMDYNKRRIEMKGFSEGGISVYELNDLNDSRSASRFVSISGAGEFSSVDLSKMLSGKQVRVSTYIGIHREMINTSSEKKDIETMFELLYLKLTQPKIDKVTAENTKQIMKYNIKQSERNPKVKFGRELARFYGENHPRIIFDTEESVDALSLDKMLHIFKDRYADMNSFSFAIVGDLAPEKIEPMLEKYLSNLPTLDRNESYVDRKMTYKKGKHKFVRFYNNQYISNITITYKSKISYNLKTSMELAAFRSILSVRLREYIREEKSGVYGIRVNVRLTRELEDEATFVVSFSCDPERRDELISYVYQLIDEIKIKGVTQKELDVFYKKFKTSFEVQKKTPRYWMQTLYRTYAYGDNLENLLAVDNIAKEITISDISRVANLLIQEDILETQLNPKDKEKDSR